MTRELASEQIEIGENVYRLTRVNFDDAKAVLKMVGDLVGPSLGELIGDGDVQALEAGKIDGAALGSATTVFFRGLDLKQLQRLEEIYARATAVGVYDEDQGKKVWSKLDKGKKALHFSDFPAEYIPWLVASTRLNLAPFFGGLQEIIADLKGMTATASE